MSTSHPLRNRKYQWLRFFRYSYVERVNKSITLVYNLLSHSLFTVAIMLLIYVFWREYASNAYTVEPFEVPKSWTERGMTGKVMAERVLTGTQGIIQELEGNYETFGLAISLKEDLTEDEVEVGGFNIRSLLRHIARLTGKEDRRIRGSIIEQDSRVQLTLSIANAQTLEFTVPISRQDSLVQLASEYTLQQTNPYALGRYFVLRKNYEKAFEQVGYIRTRFSDDYQLTALNLWGSIQRNQQRWDAAIIRYKEMNTLSPKDSRGYLGLLRVASLKLREVLQKNNFDTTTRAVKTLRRTIDTCSYQALNGTITGDVFGGNRDATLKNTLSSVYHEVGFVQYTLRNYEQAIEFLLKGKLMMPANHNIHNLLAYSYLKTGNGQLAERSIRQAVFLKPNNGSLWDSYAEIMDELKKEEDYFYCLEQVCRCTRDKRAVTEYAQKRWPTYVGHERFKAIVRRYGMPEQSSLATHYKKMANVR